VEGLAGRTSVVAGESTGIGRGPGGAPRPARRRGRHGVRRLLAGLVVAAATLAAGPGAAATGGINHGSPAAPTVTILSPVDGAIVGGIVEVTVSVQSGTPVGRGVGEGTPISGVTLEFDGQEVGHHRPVSAVQGSYTHRFEVAVARHSGPVTLQAHAYQGSVRSSLRGTSAPVTVVVDGGETGPATVRGIVSDDLGEPVPGATVTAYGAGEELAVVVTGEDGAFVLEHLRAVGGPVSVVARAPATPLPADEPVAPGAAAATRVLYPLPGGTYDLDLVLWTELPLVAPGSERELGDTSTLVTPDGSVVVDGLPKELGILAGTARAFGPTANPHAFPGEFATREAGLESGLFSAGFASVNLLADDGDGGLVPVSELRDAEGRPVEVELRFRLDRADWHVIQDGNDFPHLPSHVDRPDRIDVPLYRFDEQAGDWLLTPRFGWLEDVTGPIPPSELPAIRDGSHPHDVYVVGVVDRFSFYNLDFPTRDACVSGRLVDERGEPLRHKQVEFRAADDSSPFSNVITATTDGDGRFQVRVPRSETGPGDDWNSNGQVDAFAVTGRVASGGEVFDFGGDGIPTPPRPESDGCERLGDVSVGERDKVQARTMTFQLTFLDEADDTPLFVTPRSYHFPNYAYSRLQDLAVPVGSLLWREACQNRCNVQASTDEEGLAIHTIPVLERDRSDNLHGSFAYHKLRPDLRHGAWETAGDSFVVPIDTPGRKATIKLGVEYFGPPTVVMRRPDPDSSPTFYFDDMVVLEASGTDVAGNSFDHLVHNFVWSSPTARLPYVASARTGSVHAGLTFGPGSHSLTVEGWAPSFWASSDTLPALAVTEVTIDIDPDRLQLVTGQTARLDVTVLGSRDRFATFVSSAAGVASVDRTGQVTGVGAGTATITARSVADPTKTATAEVSVEHLLAVLTVHPASGDTSTDFTFDSASSEGDIETVAWDLGDGTTSTDPVVSHRYDTPGTYTVTLTVTSTSGATAQTSRDVEVVGAGANLPPVASFTLDPPVVNPGATVRFDASASEDPDGDIVAWAWDFGDGGTSSGETVEHVYTTSGTFTVTLTVADDDGATATAFRTLRVSHPPAAAFTVFPEEGVAPLEVTVNGAASADPDGQLKRYTWDFGDGTVVLDGGAAEEHTYTEPGTYTIRLTVTDDGGLTDSTERTVEVRAGLLANELTGQPYLTYAFDASGVAPEADTYTWRFGDGRMSATSTAQVTHRYTAPGTYRVSVVASPADGPSLSASVDVEVAPPSGISGFVAVDAGALHTLALDADGRAWSWGEGGGGRLGGGSYGRENVPVPVSGLTSIVAVSAGGEHSLALRADGTVWAWGSNSWGRLGDGTTITRTEPVQVVGLTDVVAIAAGGHHSLALTADGAVWAWGANHSGQLGDGTTQISHTPVRVLEVADAVAVAAGSFFSLALMADGTYWAWGSNAYGQFGDGSQSGTTTVPIRIPDGPGFVSLVTGGVHTLGVATDGTAYGWGGNYFGQVGDGTTTTRTTPVPVMGIPAVASLAAGLDHSVAGTPDGRIHAWGWNENGQIGIGSTSLMSDPAAVTGSPPAIAVSAGMWHSLALTGDGTAWAWGTNTAGQLGNGTFVNRYVPGLVSRW
jgi:alpha-tubulin suppressor-like RCC1 family protein/PKD repeat protein